MQTATLAHVTVNSGPSPLLRRDYKLERSFESPLGWSTFARNLARDYWIGREFLVPRLDDIGMVAVRGHWLGNAFSYDMKKLRGRLVIEPISEHVLACSLVIDTKLQIITEWNEAFFRLEMAEFKAVLQGTGRLHRQWPEFEAAMGASAVKFTLTGGIAGRRLPAHWSDELRRLES